tara:strand:+ start:56875 stop:57426 length:552 start_codon:yes stop_codon:yes gene_type:complete
MSTSNESSSGEPTRSDSEGDDDIARRMAVMTRMIVTLDGLWYRNVLAESGSEVALAMDIKVFQAQFRIATRVIRERFGLDGHSRVDKAKVMEEMSRLYGHKFEILEQPKSVTMRVHRCSFLEALRAAGSTDHDCREVCRAIRPAWFGEIEPRTKGAGEVQLGLPDQSGPCDWTIEQPDDDGPE